MTVQRAAEAVRRLLRPKALSVAQAAARITYVLRRTESTRRSKWGKRGCVPPPRPLTLIKAPKSKSRSHHHAEARGP